MSDRWPFDPEIPKMLQDEADFLEEASKEVYGKGGLDDEDTEQEADGPTFAHLSDVTDTRAEMDRIADADDAWTTVSVKGGVGWHNAETNEVIYTEK